MAICRQSSLPIDPPPDDVDGLQTDKSLDDMDKDISDEQLRAELSKIEREGLNEVNAEDFADAFGLPEDEDAQFSQAFRELLKRSKKE